eukprot:COSAG01_NODE_542_length_15693_cov_13.246253_21_plen_86_part_00
MRQFGDFPLMVGTQPNWTVLQRVVVYPRSVWLPDQANEVLDKDMITDDLDVAKVPYFQNPYRVRAQKPKFATHQEHVRMMHNPPL